MIWAFVDYENVGSLERLPLKNYDRVIVFFGPNNHHLKFGEIPVGDGCQMQLIKLQTQGKNNLDFHLVFQLGRFHETVSADIEFHLVSNDNGMNGILEHLKTLGRKCLKVKIDTANKSNPAKKVAHHSPGWNKVTQILRNTAPKHRPSNKEKLINWIRAVTRQIVPPEKPETIYGRLVMKKMIEEGDNDQIRYPLETGGETKPA